MEIIRVRCYICILDIHIRHILYCLRLIYYFYLRRGVHTHWTPLSSNILFMDNFDFWASIGGAETYKPFRKPSMLRVADWWKEFSVHPDIDEFDFYLFGGFAEQRFGAYNHPTWDVDIAIVGELNEFKYKPLKRLLDDGYNIGFDNQFNIDMFWISDITAAFRDDFKPYSYVRNGRTFVMHRYGEVIQKNFTADEEYTLPEGLTQYVWYEPNYAWKKVQERINSGLYAGVMVDCKHFFE